MIQNIFVDYLLPIGTLVVLEGLLSGDNALVLAVLVKHLPLQQRKKALYYGIIGAFVLRAIGIILAVFLIRLWYLRGLGALYLAYLSIAHFIRHSRSKDLSKPKQKPGFWHTVIVVELTDVAFAIDSILVAVALSKNIYVIYTGGMLGIIAMRIAAGGILKLLDKYGDLEHVAYILIAWISVKLFIETGESYAHTVSHKEFFVLPPWIFWGVMGLIIIIGGFYAYKKRKPDGSAESEEVKELEKLDL